MKGDSNSNSRERTPLLRVSVSSPASGKEGKEPWYRRYMKGKNAWVGFLCIMLLLTALMNSILFKSLTTKFTNYMTYINLVTTFLFVPIFWGIVAYERMFTSYITPEMLFGAVHTSGSYQALLANAIIPVTMGASVALLGTRYGWKQCAGAMLILLGVVVVLLPQMTGSGGDGGEGTDGGGDALSSNVPVFNLMFLVSVIPSAASSVYKELAFNQQDIDVNYLQAWVSNWQLVFCLVLLPLNCLSMLGPQTVPFGQLGSAVVDGFWCNLGLDSVVAPGCLPQPTSHTLQCDDCSGAGLLLFLYMFFNILYNILIVAVIKHGGSALMYVVMTLRLPLVQVAFSLSLVQDPPDTLGMATFAGLALIVCGLVAYRGGEGASGGEEDITVGFAGRGLVPITIRRHAMHHARDEAQLRDLLYARIGIIDSPRSSRTPGSSWHGGKGGSKGQGILSPASGQVTYGTLPPGGQSPGALRRSRVARAVQAARGSLSSSSSPSSFSSSSSTTAQLGQKSVAESAAAQQGVSPNFSLGLLSPAQSPSNRMTSARLKSSRFSLNSTNSAAAPLPATSSAPIGGHATAAPAECSSNSGGGGGGADGGDGRGNADDRASGSVPLPRSVRIRRRGKRRSKSSARGGSASSEEEQQVVSDFS